jgi:hypothetical protein
MGMADENLLLFNLLSSQMSSFSESFIAKRAEIRSLVLKNKTVSLGTLINAAIQHHLQFKIAKNEFELWAEKPQHTRLTFHRRHSKITQFEHVNDEDYIGKRGRSHLIVQQFLFFDKICFLFRLQSQIEQVSSGSNECGECKILKWKIISRLSNICYIRGSSAIVSTI